jgi:glutaredoxin
MAKYRRRRYIGRMLPVTVSGGIMRLFCRYLFMLAHTITGPAIVLCERLTSSRRVVRPDSDQQRVDNETRHLMLYQSRGCPFCTRTRRVIKRLSLKIETCDALGDAASRAQLQAGGGFVRVPCLRIADTQGNVTWLYESADIIQYLSRRYDQL